MFQTPNRASNKSEPVRAFRMPFMATPENSINKVNRTIKDAIALISKSEIMQDAKANDSHLPPSERILNVFLIFARIAHRTWTASKIRTWPKSQAS